MTARVMAEAVTGSLGGSAVCPREAEPPQEHDLAGAKSRGTEEQENQSPLVLGRQSLPKSMTWLEPSHEEQRNKRINRPLDNSYLRGIFCVNYPFPSP